MECVVLRLVMLLPGEGGVGLGVVLHDREHGQVSTELRSRSTKRIRVSPYRSTKRPSVAP